MKTFYIVTFSLVFSVSSFAQSEKTLEETKAYIIKMINDYAYKENSTKRTIRVEFDNDFLKVSRESRLLGMSTENIIFYNFGNVYRFKGPIKKPGDISHIIIWADSSQEPNIYGWTKRAFEVYIHSYEGSEELMKAFKHLNKLLIEKKPKVEKF